MGRRGRRNRAHERRQGRRDFERERLIEERKRRRQEYLDRILPRLRRFCPLSSIGICAPRDGRIEPDRREFFSVEGKVAGFMSGKDHFHKQFDYGWDGLTETELADLAKVKRWDPILPKPAMEILAEAYAGLHEDL